MAVGLPTPKSREQILSEMLTEYVGLTGINDLNTGSAVTQFFDVVARSVARTSGDIFQILRDFSVERATGEALNRIGREERVYRNTAQVASGKIKVTDTSFEKISTKIYSGAPSPNIGAIEINVSDASKFPSSGRLYIGRGTPNVEGPINYSSVVPDGSFWKITLDSPTQKFHNISESIILGQGGTRNVPAGTTVISPGTGATADINYSVSSAALLLDGENENKNVQVVAQEPGTNGNAPAGAIREFVTAPFSGAAVINEVPFSNGADNESDDNYRDRIKKERLSRGLGTALAVKNAVLGAQAPDENARVTSNEIDTSNPEQTILYIDNGEGYEETSEGVGLESVIESAIGGEQTFQLATGGQQTSVRKAFIQSSNSTPFAISSFDKLAILVGGVVFEHTFLEGDFQAEGAATAYEIVASINNNPDSTFEATTAEAGTKVVIQAKSEDNEFLQLTTPSSGVDAGPILAFPTNEVATVLLYKNKELLNKNGRSAFVITKNQFDWSNTITDGDTLIISVDGTDFITYNFINEDFIADGQHSTVNNQNSLSSWVNVINAKITGVTAEINGERIKLTSNLGPSNRASIQIDNSSDLVLKGMFSEELGLTAQGNEADFELSRNTGQIKLNKLLKEGDSVNVGSEFTRAEIQSSPILGGQTTISSTAYVWLVVDDTVVEPVEIGVTADTFLTVSKPGNGIVRYESTSLSAFGNVEIGDYVIIWSEELSVKNRLEGRVYAKTDTTLDIRVTGSEESSAILEGPILYQEGFSVIRTEYAPQKIKVSAGIYTVNDIAAIFNNQLKNAVVSVEDDEIFIFRTNTEDIHGAMFLADFNDGAKALNLIKNSFSKSINSQLAFYESGFKDRQWPSFVHGKITTDQFSDPPNGYINTVDSSEDLNALGFDPSGFLCFAQPFNDSNDISSKECVEIKNYTGTTVNVEDSVFYKRSRINDRFYFVNGYDFGHNDSIVTVLDNDPTGKTFNMPLFRTAVTKITHPANANHFRAWDKEGGGGCDIDPSNNTTQSSCLLAGGTWTTPTEFTKFFGNNFAFDNYKALMQAKNVVDPLSLTNQDAILYRSVEWGNSGEKVGIGYFYPTTPNEDISHIVSVNNEIEVKLFLKSGPAKTTTINGTTEWDVTIIPNPNYDLVTYTHSGTGTAPGLTPILSGDYVSIISTGEFLTENQGSYRVDSATATSFTIKRPLGVAIEQSDVATLETGTINFFEKSDTTAEQIVDYVTDNLSDYITAEIVDDNGSTGSGIINLSTAEDSDFAYDSVKLLDGKNYILSSDIDAIGGLPQFVFKTPLDLPTFSTNTTDAYSFNNGEKIKLVPTTSLQLTKFLNILAVTGYTTLGDIKSVDRNTNVQLSTNVIGNNGAVQIAGGVGNFVAAAVEGSAIIIGDQANAKSLVSINTATSDGFHSDQWVKVFASEIQKKVTGINALNSIKISSANPSVGFTKIELFDKGVSQRLFGRNRYHTRTRGKTFKVEKQGDLTAIIWNENGTQPNFLTSNIDIKDSSPSTLTIFRDGISSIVDLRVDTGDMRFDEVAVGDILTITNRLSEKNNGNFLVVGRSDDARTVRIINSSGVSELVTGNFTITDNVAVLGTQFTVGTTILTEGVDFVAGASVNDTASNLSAAIALIPSINSNSDGAIVNIESEVAAVTIPIFVTGGGATASGSELEAPVANTGDLVFKTEVQEGDSVIINSDFSILNQGTFRVVRRFKDSIYIDNPNSVEEEVTIGNNNVELYSNNPIPLNLIFTNASTTVVSVGNVDWTSIVEAGDFIKDASKGDNYYYKIDSVDSTFQITLATPFQESSSSVDGIEAVYTDLDIDLTDFDVEKLDGKVRLKWAGAGAEPSFENLRPGNIATLGEDFDAANEGDFHVVDSGEKLQEVTQFKMSREVDINNSEYGIMYSSENVNEYHFYFKGPDPGATANPISVGLVGSESAEQVAVKFADAINTQASADFTAVAEGDTVTVTTTGVGETTDAFNFNISGEFAVEVKQQGRRNFVDFINVNGVSEAGILVTDVLEFHKEAMEFKQYEGTVPGDKFVISDSFIGENNVGTYTVVDVLSESEIIVSGNTVDVEKTLLDSNFNKVYVEESTPYVGYKQIEFITTNPANLNSKNVMFTTDNQFEKISELGGVSISAIGKLQYPTNIIKGVDAYKFNTGLIGEANRIVYGEPRDNTTYPGVAAAGAEIFIKAPLTRRIQVSIDVRVKTGVPFSTIVEEVRNSVASLIRGNDVGKPIPISNIVSNVDGIVGVQAVAISSPQYDSQNDVIKINAGEKALILDIISDIIVSKID